MGALFPARVCCPAAFASAVGCDLPCLWRAGPGRDCVTEARGWRGPPARPSESADQLSRALLASTPGALRAWLPGMQLAGRACGEVGFDLVERGTRQEA